RHRAAGLAHGADHPAEGLQHDVVAGLLAERPVAPVAGDLEIDHARIERRERLVVDPQLLRRAASEALQHHVGLAREAVRDRHALGRLQVQRNAALVVVDRQEDRRFALVLRQPAARVVPDAGWLDLDDVGAQLAQVLGAERARQNLGEIEDPDVLERSHGMRLVGPRLQAARAGRTRNRTSALATRVPSAANSSAATSTLRSSRSITRADEWNSPSGAGRWKLVSSRMVSACMPGPSVACTALAAAESSIADRKPPWTVP